MLNRRSFLHRTAASLGAAIPADALVRRALITDAYAAAPRGFVDVLRRPDSVVAQTAARDIRLNVANDVEFGGSGVVVGATRTGDALRITLATTSANVRRIGLRWKGDLDTTRLILGDAWERGYGDLEWRNFVPDRVMPWYCATWDGALTHAYGVRTDANAFCFWFADPDGISLWTDVRSGGSALQLGSRTLTVCDVVSRAGLKGESSFAALHAFCKVMCTNARLPLEPVYGSNDWYYAYGKNSAQTVLADADHIVELSPAGTNRPYVVIDDGWQPGRGADRAGLGTWDRGNEKFPDMATLVADIKKRGARPGVWIRPLQAPADVPDAWRSPRDRNVLDPTVPEVRARIVADILRLQSWGFSMMKHDYTTFDLFGRWGSTMGSALTRDGWTFAEGPKRTTAEVISALYRAIRTAAGDMLVIGCNTVSHLSAGAFQICRIGDDTSGTEWARSRRMGVNTLAFRAAQHGAFYTADADCIGVTAAVPWEYNRRWLDLVARSGTMTFVSLAPDALGAEQKRDLKAALTIAAKPQPLAEPLDWQRTTWPTRWRLMGEERRFEWGTAEG